MWRCSRGCSGSTIGRYALNVAWLKRTQSAARTADADPFYHPDAEKLLSDIRGLRDLAPEAAEFPKRLARRFIEGREQTRQKRACAPRPF